MPGESTEAGRGAAHLVTVDASVANAWLIGEQSSPAIDPVPVPAVQQMTLRLATEHRLTFHDAAHLELAQRRGSVLATLDGESRAAAGLAGVLCLDL